MKTLPFAIAWLICTQLACAKGSSHPPENSADNSSRVSFEELPRSKTYWPSRNGISTEGFILVCLDDFKADDGICIDKKSGQNAWRRVESTVPEGFKLDSYEFHFDSRGARILQLYFAPIKAKADGPKDTQPTFTGPITIRTNKVVVTPRRP